MSLFRSRVTFKAYERKKVFYRSTIKLKKEKQNMNTFRTLLFVHPERHDHYLKVLAVLTKITPSRLVEMTEGLTWQSW